mgnify:CR=1 FL=1
MEYKIGHRYIDKGGSSHPDDEFLSWINIEGSGMRNADGIRALNYVSKKSDHLPAYIILISHEVKRIGNPWEDIVDHNTATIMYWGDAKLDKIKGYSEFRGNMRLLQTWEAILDGRINEVPPILHFSKPKKGIVKFNGLCALTDLQITWFEQQSEPVKNYRFKLTILDQDVINVRWLHERANNKDISQLNATAPKTWTDYINGKINKLDVWAKSILKKEDQLPETNSADGKVLSQLHDLGNLEFEAVVVAILSSLPHVSHKITRTRPTRDGGFDFYGEFSIPYPMNYNIAFLGEAKKFERNASIGVRHVSRLVARLNRGEYGLFVTTSYYTEQAQREILQDGYPVKLFTGMDLVKILHELRLIQNGEIKRDWLRSVVDRI